MHWKNYFMMDMFSISSEEAKQCVLDEGVVYGKRTV